MLVREELKEAPDLLGHAGVAVHERERGQQHLVSDAEETAEQRVLRAKGRERLQKGGEKKKTTPPITHRQSHVYGFRCASARSHTARIPSLLKQTTEHFYFELALWEKLHSHQDRGWITQPYGIFSNSLYAVCVLTISAIRVARAIRAESKCKYENGLSVYLMEPCARIGHNPDGEK